VALHRHIHQDGQLCIVRITNAATGRKKAALFHARATSVITMTIDQQDIVNNFGILVSVFSHELIFENECNMISAISLVFEDGIVFHEALDTDEISCSSQLNDKYDVRMDISKDSPWNKAIGKPVLWTWHLTNQQGYSDAVQYEFSNLRNQGNPSVQLLVIASQIETYNVCPKL